MNMPTAESVWSYLVALFKSITLEPFILLNIGALGVAYGAEVQTNLKLWKVRVRASSISFFFNAPNYMIHTDPS